MSNDYLPVYLEPEVKITDLISKLQAILSVYGDFAVKRGISEFEQFYTGDFDTLTKVNGDQIQLSGINIHISEQYILIH